jgi:hypothetical protein
VPYDASPTLSHADHRSRLHNGIWHLKRAHVPEFSRFNFGQEALSNLRIPLDIDAVTEDAPRGGDSQQLSCEADQSTHEATRDLPAKLEAAAVIGMGIVFFLGVAFQKSPLNGSLRLTGWQWPWRDDIELVRSIAFLLIPFGLIQYVVKRVEAGSYSRVSIRLGMLVLGNFLMQIMAMVAEPDGFGWLRGIVMSPAATSYYSDAEHINGLAGWLHHFGLASLAFHSSTHPPGPVLFYYMFLKLFGSPAATLAGGCTIGFLGSLGVVVTYAFASLWTDSQRARLMASAFYAVLPAVTVFFPEMDQVYPIFSMLLIFFWCRALRSETTFPREAIYLSVVLFASTFFAYNLLVVGAFLAYYALYWLWRRRWSSSSILRLIRSLGIAGGACAAAYAALWLATGFDPIASFRHALRYQQAYAEFLPRSYLLSVFFDPYDFFLGAGMLALPLLLFYLYRMTQDFSLSRHDVALTLIGLATILTVDFSGILRGEAARVWLFLQPLLVVPVTIELSRYRGKWLVAVFTMQWLVIACLKAKIQFIKP